MWFSYGLDLTNTLQRQKKLEDDGYGPGKAPLWQRADERFFWNRYLQSRLIDVTTSGQCDVSYESLDWEMLAYQQLSRYILPVLQGCESLGQSSNWSDQQPSSFAQPPSTTAIYYSSSFPDVRDTELGRDTLFEESMLRATPPTTTRPSRLSWWTHCRRTGNQYAEAEWMDGRG